MSRLLKLILCLQLVFNFTLVTNAETDGVSLTFDQALEKIYQEKENEITSKDLADLTLNELRELKEDRLNFIESMQDKLDQIDTITYPWWYGCKIFFTVVELGVLAVLLSRSSHKVFTYVKALTPGGIALAGNTLKVHLTLKDYHNIEKAIEIADQNITRINNLISSKEGISNSTLTGDF